MKRLMMFGAMLCAASLFVGCASEEEGGGEETASAIPASLFVSAEPADAATIMETKKTAEVGDTVTITGLIGGKKKTFVDGLATFYLTDTHVEDCTRKAHDSCPTPWDYCCTPREELNASMATIQIVDDAGKVITEGARDVHGMIELVPLTVVGTVEKTDKNTVFVINATKIYVGSKDPA